MTKSPKTLSAGRPSARSGAGTTLADVSDKKQVKRMSFELSVEQHAKLKINAARQNKSVKELLTEYVDSLPD